MAHIGACPECWSLDIVPFMGYELGKQHHCQACDYIGPVLLEFASLDDYHAAHLEHEVDDGSEEVVDDWFTRDDE